MNEKTTKYEYEEKKKKETFDETTVKGKEEEEEERRKVEMLKKTENEYEEKKKKEAFDEKQDKMRQVRYRTLDEIVLGNEAEYEKLIELDEDDEEQYEYTDEELSFYQSDENRMLIMGIYEAEYDKSIELNKKQVELFEERLLDRNEEVAQVYLATTDLEVSFKLEEAENYGKSTKDPVQGHRWADYDPYESEEEDGWVRTLQDGAFG